MFLTLISSTILSIASLISAQEPPYLSPVLIQPGLATPKCLQPQNGASTSGTPIVLADCTGSTAQEWFFSNGLIRVFSNMCITVPNGNTATGQQLEIQTCDSSNNNQLWFYNFFNRNQISLTNDRGTCIDLTSGSTANGNIISVASCVSGNHNQVWNVGYLANTLPATSEEDQFGINDCGTHSSQSSSCQTIWINDVDDFCLWAPPSVGTIGDTEREEVGWCTKAGRGTRVIPDGTLSGVHFVHTPDYVQVTGVGHFENINIPKGDSGGELDPHGSDGKGNPIGGLVYGNTFGSALQYHEWTSFISDGLFCFRACVGPNAAELCQHIYDEMGCYWNMPANYDSGVFESCLGDDDLPMGVYGTSTWHQGTSPTPSAHPAASSSDCRRLSTVSVGTVTSGSSGSSSTTTTTSTTTSPSSTPTGHAVHPQASSSKCLTAASASKGAHVTIQDCNGSAGQQWTRSGSTFKVFGSFCLDNTNGVETNGNKLQVWSCSSGNKNQEWTTNSQNEIVLENTSFCVDLTNGVTTDGNQIQVWHCSTGNKNQEWHIV